MSRFGSISLSLLLLFTSLHAEDIREGEFDPVIESANREPKHFGLVGSSAWQIAAELTKMGSIKVKVDKALRNQKIEKFELKGEGVMTGIRRLSDALGCREFVKGNMVILSKTRPALFSMGLPNAPTPDQMQKLAMDYLGRAAINANAHAKQEPIFEEMSDIDAYYGGRMQSELYRMIHKPQNPAVVSHALKAWAYLEIERTGNADYRDAWNKMSSLRISVNRQEEKFGSLLQQFKDSLKRVGVNPVATGSIQQRNVTFKFENVDPGSLLLYVADYLGLTIKKDGDNFILEPRARD